MTTREDVLYYCECILKKRTNDEPFSMYLHPDDYDLLTPIDLTRFKNVSFLSYPSQIAVSKMLKDYPDRKNKAFIGSLPTENIGKWTKTC